MNLSLLSVFLCIVEQGSLAAAGRELGLSAATVTERLAALEAHYGVTLLQRTTRALHLTEEGRQLVDGARRLLDEAEALDNRIRHGSEALTGLIRVSAPFDPGHSRVAPVIDAFLAEHPDVTIELLLSDGYVNIVDEGIDVALRLGDLADSSLRVRSLGLNERAVCAAPSYIARYGVPRTPADLDAHNCLLMRFGNALDNLWRFRDGDREIRISVDGNRIANDGRLVREWCLAGHGIARKSFWDVREDIESGALVRLLDEYSPPPAAIQLLFPPGRAQPRRVQAFASRLVAAFER